MLRVIFTLACAFPACVKSDAGEFAEILGAEDPCLGGADSQCDLKLLQLRAEARAEEAQNQVTVTEADVEAVTTGRRRRMISYSSSRRRSSSYSYMSPRRRSSSHSYSTSYIHRRRHESGYATGIFSTGRRRRMVGHYPSGHYGNYLPAGGYYPPGHSGIYYPSGGYNPAVQYGYTVGTHQDGRRRWAPAIAAGIAGVAAGMAGAAIVAGAAGAASGAMGPPPGSGPYPIVDGVPPPVQADGFQPPPQQADGIQPQWQPAGGFQPPAQQQAFTPQPFPGGAQSQVQPADGFQPAVQQANVPQPGPQGDGPSASDALSIPVSTLPPPIASSEVIQQINEENKIKAMCENNPGCAELKLTGACCPNENGLRLGCCGNSA